MRGGNKTEAQRPDPGKRVMQVTAATCQLPTGGPALISLGQGPLTSPLSTHSLPRFLLPAALHRGCAGLPTTGHSLPL